MDENFLYWRLDLIFHIVWNRSGKVWELIAGLLILIIRIMTTPYGREEEYFTYSGFLVLNNRIVAFLFAIAIMIYNKESLKNVAPLHTYFLVSISNAAATFCQYEALKYVR
jgi:adenosine 3'-phospho 5'-phosphosulfate transporter B2